MSGPVQSSMNGRRPTGLAGVRRNMSLDLVGAVGIGITSAVVGALLPAIARQGGLVPLGIAALATAPFIANLLSAFAGRVGPRTTGQFAVMRVIGALSLVVLALVGHPLVAVLAAILYWISISFTVPLQTRFWGAMYPSSSRGRIIGLVGTGKAAAAGLAAVTVGLVADHAGAPIGMAIAGALGAGCALAALGLRVSSGEAPRRYSAREAIRVLSNHRALKPMMLGQALYGGGMIAASPLYALVYVDRLRLPLSEVGTVAVFGAIATTVSYVGWGMLVDRRGGIFALRAGSMLGVASLALYVVAPDLRLLWVAALASGLAGAAIDLGIQGSIQKHVPLEDRAPAMAGWNALTGARGVAAPIISSALVQSGMVDLSTGLMLCLVPAALGAIVYFRSETAPATATSRREVAAVQPGRLVTRLRSLPSRSTP
jgi:MFS family permease